MPVRRSTFARSFRRLTAATAAALMAVASLTVVTAAPAAAAAEDPVVIATGMTAGPIFEPAYWPLRDRLRAAGYTVDIFTMPDYGMGDIHANAANLAAFVDGVRARTGAAKVDLIGHSMGGLVSRDYVKNLGGAAKVDSLIMLGTPNYGTTLASIGSFFWNCIGIVGCDQMAIGSDYLDALNAGDDTIGSVRYTAISTINDELVIPYWNVFLANNGNISNVTVQGQCWLRFVGHLGLIYDGAVADGIQDALRGAPVRLNCWAW